MFTVSRATVSDVDTLVSFNQQMAHETEGKSLDGAVLKAGVQAMLDDENKGFYLVCRANREASANADVVGQLMVTKEWSDWRNRDFWWIQSVFVRKEFRGQGVYRRLHDAVRALAHDNGAVAGIRLYVETENVGAQQTYEKMGMKRSHYLMYEEEPVPVSSSILPPRT